MTSATTPEEREAMRDRLKKTRAAGYTYVGSIDGLALERLLDERDDLEKKLDSERRMNARALGEINGSTRTISELRAEVERLRKPAKGEIVRERFAISHAPKGVKGGPWEAVNDAIAVPTSRVDDAWTIDDLAKAHQLARAVMGKISAAHVVRLVTRKKAKK